MKQKSYLLLHLLLLLYAASSVCSKLAAGADFLSPRFLLCYGAALLLLAVGLLGPNIYAIIQTGIEFLA